MGAIGIKEIKVSSTPGVPNRWRENPSTRTRLEYDHRHHMHMTIKPNYQ